MIMHSHWDNGIYYMYGNGIQYGVLWSKAVQCIIKYVGRSYTYRVNGSLVERSLRGLEM